VLVQLDRQQRACQRGGERECAPVAQAQGCEADEQRRRELGEGHPSAQGREAVVDRQEAGADEVYGWGLRPSEGGIQAAAVE
jgi:hypothetical protein